MPLQTGQISGEMKQFILQVNTLKQDDAEKAIDAFCNKIEATIFEAIRGVTITILPGFIQVVTPSGTGSNPSQIVLNKVVS